MVDARPTACICLRPFFFAALSPTPARDEALASSDTLHLLFAHNTFDEVIRDIAVRKAGEATALLGDDEGAAMLGGRVRACAGVRA